MKQHQDVQDIKELLVIASRRGETIKDAYSWVPVTFMEAAVPRIKEFMTLISSKREPWLAIGYTLPETEKLRRGGEPGIVLLYIIAEYISVCLPYRLSSECWSAPNVSVEAATRHFKRVYMLSEEHRHTSVTVSALCPSSLTSHSDTLFC
ncbi:hypothetical protein BDY19DRAFT_1002544 [Irpex rosettiformis]|uniref:Uncharacterized protein n=1 Tax=Irpex rosettiformis TaxID=378272 RepID=A0ACB8ULH8_9APHY|nr:hypothetical protein BDY19DRAFT_1002544 [Irpex rosettiformis]